MNVAREARGARVSGQDPPESGAPERAAPRVHEHRLVTRPRGQHRPAALEPLAQRRARLASERNRALAIALARHRHGARAQVEARALESGQLGHPQPARVRQLEQRAVAEREWLLPLGLGEQALDVLDRQRARQTLLAARRRQGRERIGGVR